MAMEFEIRNLDREVSENGLDNVVKIVDLVMTKSKTITVPEYDVEPARPEILLSKQTFGGETAIPGIPAVMGERQVRADEEVSTTETVTVQEGGKWIQKDVTTTKTISKAQFEEVDLYDAAGENVIGTHSVPIMESYEVEPEVVAVDAVPEVTEDVVVRELVPAVTSTERFLEEKKYIDVRLTTPDADAFTAYDDITEAEALSWAKDVIGASALAEIEAELDEKIAIQESDAPPTNITGKPW